MHIIKKILLFFSVLLFTVLLSSGGALYWAYKNPNRVWPLIERNFLPDDLKVTGNILLQIQRISGLNFKVLLNIESLEIKKQNPLLDLQVNRVNTEISIFPFSENEKFFVNNFEISALNPLSFQIPKSENPTSLNPHQQIQSILQKISKLNSWVRIENFALNVNELQIKTAELTEYKIHFEANKDASSADGQTHFKSDIQLPASLALNLEGEIRALGNTILLKTALNLTSPSIFVEQQIQASIGDLVEINSTGEVRIKIQKNTIRAIPEITVKMNSEGADLQIHSKIVGLLNPFLTTKIIDAQMHLPFEKNVLWSSEKSEFTASSLITFFPTDKKIRPILEKSCKCKVTQALQVKANGNIWVSNLFVNDLNLLPIMDAQLQVESLTNNLFNLNLQAGAEINQQQKNWTIKPRLNLKARVNHFSSLSKILDSYRILVPAPFDVLDGPIQVSMVGPVDFANDKFKFPFAAQAQLSSKKQNLDVTVDSSISLNQKFDAAAIDAKLIIHKLEIDFPPLNPTKGNPRIVADKRIQAHPVVQKKKSPFKLSLTYQVITEHPGAIHLNSQYFKPYLPLSVNLNHTPNKNNPSSLNIETFNIEYLRRKMTVEKMTIDFSKQSEKIFYVDGRLSVQQTNYKIFIDIHGLLKKPNIVLTSEPELPRSEIINVLIYDRTSDQLVTSDLKTSGQVEAAVADRAIGLFGIWAFASTPIKGFSYNPATKVYVATIQISDDVTANVGTTWESTTQLELQKRISRNWVLTAAWKPAEQNESELSQVVLQWEKRFD
jgi:hypothetical protein